MKKKRQETSDWKEKQSDKKDTNFLCLHLSLAWIILHINLRLIMKNQPQTKIQDTS
jgi:hypothetical protein